LEARHRAFREESFRDALDRTVAAAIYDALDYDLKLPLPQQLEMAAEISRELHIPIPPDALEFAGAAATYIGRYLPRYRMSKATARKVLGAE
jgi:hypothetical protein